MITDAGPMPDARGLPHGLGAGPPPVDRGATRGPRMLHGDRRRTGRAVSTSSRSEPVVSWSRDVGGPVESQVVSSPDEQTLYVSSLGGTLTALAAHDGSLRWAFALGDRGYSTPCIADDGTVFVGSDAKRFFALSPAGRIEWSLETEGEADTGAAIAPDGSLVFAAGRTAYAVTRFGAIRWRFSAKRKIFTAPAIDDKGRVFFGSQDHHAYALDAEGRETWAVDLGSDVDGAPSIGDDGGVFVGTDAGDVVRLDANDGKTVWSVNVGGFVRGALSVARNGDVLVGVYGPTPRAVRIRGATGEVVGGFPVQGTGAREFGVHGGAAEDESGTLFFGTQGDEVIAVDAVGNTLWRFATGGDVDAPVTLLSDGTVVVASDDGLVRALRAAR